ncbi:MAG: nucleotidyltransferase substrate binding protein [Planctomycetota bacterium]|nr:nucleotidyltransferase substrate binding protein [Planctomycetota bacterium]
MSKSPEPPRWQYRLDNFTRALALLREAVDTAAARPLTQLEKEGAVRRFEYSLELAWKTLKDYLQSEKVKIEPVTPKEVVRQAFTAGIIDDATVWMDALDARNEMAHNYDEAEFATTLAGVENRYLAALTAAHNYLTDKAAQK